jgi:Mycobacterium 19 kDa lipoprotein antigen
MKTPQQAGRYNHAQDPAGSPPKRRPGRTIALSAAAVFVVAVFAVATPPPTASAGPTKVVVGGQDISGPGGGTPICGGVGTGYHIQGGAAFIVLSSDQTQVQEIDLMQVQLGKQWSWAPGRAGNAQVSQSGNHYTITGDIAPSLQGSPSGSPVPFEVDVTCS